MLPIDAEAAEKFLRTLFERHFDKRGKDQSIEFRSIRGIKPDVQTNTAWSRLEDVAATIKKQSLEINKQPDWNRYFGANPRTGRNRHQEEIHDIVSIFADIDAKNFTGGKVKAKAGLDSFPLTPNIIVDSGNGFHPYWILEEPLLDITPEVRLHVRQVLAGVGVALPSVFARLGGGNLES